MSCLIEELQSKDVISVENGSRIGYVTDVEAEVCSGKNICDYRVLCDCGLFPQKTRYLPCVLE